MSNPNDIAGVKKLTKSVSKTPPQAKVIKPPKAPSIELSKVGEEKDQPSTTRRVVGGTAALLVTRKGRAMASRAYLKSVGLLRDASQPDAKPSLYKDLLRRSAKDTGSMPVLRRGFMPAAIPGKDNSVILSGGSHPFAKIPELLQKKHLTRAQALDILFPRVPKHTRINMGLGVLAHELGHLQQRSKLMPVASIMRFGGGLGALGAAFAKDKKRARNYALAGSASMVPLLLVEMDASRRGSQYISALNKARKLNYSKLKPWVGVPTYAMAAASPLAVYALRTLFTRRAQNAEMSKTSAKMTTMGYSNTKKHTLTSMLNLLKAIGLSRQTKITAT